MPNETAIEQKPAPPPPVEKIRIKVDGREIEVPKMSPDWQGKLQPTTMLQACSFAGIDIPHLLNQTGDALEETRNEMTVMTFRIRKR